MKQFKTVVYFTFKELFKGRVMAIAGSLLVLQILLIAVSLGLTYGAEDKVSLDIGISLCNISVIFLAIGLGVGLLSDEIKGKTIYMILSRPITRGVFLLGKTTGLTIVIFLVAFFMGAVSLGAFMLCGGKFSTLFLWEVLFIFLQGFLILHLTILFSLFTRNIIAVLVSIILYLFGNIVDETMEILFVKTGYFFKGVLRVLYVILPNFGKLNLKDILLYQNELSLQYTLGATGYAIMYTLVLVFGSLIIFRKKDLN